MTVELIIGVAMGFIPFVDNFGMVACCLVYIHHLTISVSTSGRLSNGFTRGDSVLSRHKHHKAAQTHHVLFSSRCLAGGYHTLCGLDTQLLYC